MKVRFRRRFYQKMGSSYFIRNVRQIQKCFAF
jgi:hypothetical protein